LIYEKSTELKSRKNEDTEPRKNKNQLQEVGIKRQQKGDLRKETA